MKLRYTTFIGDRDAKTFDCLVELKPYGEDVEITHECFGHVQKRMGTALRKLKKSSTEDEKGQLVKFKGKLTDNVITAINVDYGYAIRNNKDDIDGMVQAIDSHIPCLQMNSRCMKCPEHNHPNKISWCRFIVAAYENSTP